MKLIDIGVNLTGRSFRHDLDEVIQHAQAAGVVQQVITGTNIEHSQKAIDLAAHYPDVLYSTAGVHPHHAKECDDRTLATLESLAQQSGVVAIGECGLDFKRNFSPPDVQEHWFEAQLELASSLNMPVFLHQRDAHQRFLAILGHWRDRLPAAVAHCFTGDTEQVRAYIELDLHIGITGWICDERRGQALQQAVRHIPDDRLMLETDAPYLLPRDLPLDIRPKPRERRNEPAYLPHICAAVARYREVDTATVAEHSTRAAREFFGLSRINSAMR
ncbi:MAG: TatD family hydrolase [Gammaproteobacteria bacterium]|nr:TatD family hydrolase [Gammaproteobacteria bacterium]